jgi:hypothetical protein
LSILVTALTALGSTAIVQADPISFIEESVFPPLGYVQATAHTSTIDPDDHPFLFGASPMCPTENGAVWQSPFDIGEVVARTTYLHGVSEHVRAAQAGDPICGPLFPYDLTLSVPMGGGIYDTRSWSVADHGLGEDVHVLALAVFSFGFPDGGELRGYVHGSMGMHCAKPCGKGRAAILSGNEVVSPTGSHAVGCLVMVVDSCLSTLTVQLLDNSIYPTQITGAHIHLGAPGSNGPVVLDLGATGVWSPIRVRRHPGGSRRPVLA